MSDKNTICLYARVSTADQSSGLESQVRALKEYCRASNIKEGIRAFKAVFIPSVRVSPAGNRG